MLTTIIVLLILNMVIGILGICLVVHQWHRQFNIENDVLFLKNSMIAQSQADLNSDDLQQSIDRAKYYAKGVKLG